MLGCCHIVRTHCSHCRCLDDGGSIVSYAVSFTVTMMVIVGNCVHGFGGDSGSVGSDGVLMVMKDDWKKGSFVLVRSAF